MKKKCAVFMACWCLESRPERLEGLRAGSALLSREDPMPVLGKSPTPLLWASLGAVVVGFVATTAVAERSSAAIDEAALAIASNAAPSIVHLERARAEM